MGADYHIYIHGDSNGGSRSTSGGHTKPFSVKKDESFGSMIQPAKQVMSSVANGSIVNTGVSALAKVAPWVAVVVAAVKIADKVVSTGFAHQEEYTGDYTNNVMWNNFKATINMIVNPVGLARKLIHNEFQFKKRELAREQEKVLLGNSALQDIGV